mgnify:CR=1 FL=1|jgi:hypothetical protein
MSTYTTEVIRTSGLSKRCRDATVLHPQLRLSLLSLALRFIVR